MATTHVRLRDIDGDFWEQNKELSLITPFSSFKKNPESNRVMKAIYLIWDAKSIFRKSSMSTDDIIQDVNNNFLGEPNFDWDIYSEEVEAYRNICMSRVQKKLLDLLEGIDEIEEASQSLSWADEDEYKQKIELSNMANKLYEDAIALQKELDEEIDAIELESEYALSMLEEYSINGKDK